MDMKKTLMAAGVALMTALTVTPTMAAGAPGAHLIAQATAEARTQQTRLNDSKRAHANRSRIKAVCGERLDADAPDYLRKAQVKCFKDTAHDIRETKREKREAWRDKSSEKAKARGSVKAPPHIKNAH
jgi:hypothetical protein